MMIHIKALGLVVSDKKIFDGFILKIYFTPVRPRYDTDPNHLNNY